MKKLLVFFMVFGVVIGIIGMALAITPTSKVRSSTGAAFTEISIDNVNSSPNSLRLFAEEITDGTNEARFRVNFPDGTILNDIENIAWSQFVDHGYASHVDVFLDLDDDDVVDDVLVFEYAKVDETDCDDVADYPDSSDGLIDTFGDKGIVDDGAWAWLNSGPPGPCGDASFHHNSLATWKAGVNNISGTTEVLGIEIEVDGWIEESEVFIDDVRINRDLIENFDDTTDIEVEIVELTLVSITPITLDFGSVTPGTTDNPAINGPITFDATGSNTDVHIEVSDVSGFPFEDGLKLDGEDPETKSWDLECETPEDDICEYTDETTEPTLDVPAGATPGTKTGTIIYMITGEPPT